jgi:hypothetical protein
MINGTRSSGKTKRLLSFDTKRTASKTTRPIILQLLSVYSCYGNIFTKPLPGNDRGDTHTDTHTDGKDLNVRR